MKQKSTNAKFQVQGTEITVVRQEKTNYISLTDIARHKNHERSDDLIRDWLRNRNTLEFLGILGQLHNPGFNSVEFYGIKMRAGLNSFTLTPKQWVEKTKAIGIISKTGRYGSSLAHNAIAICHMQTLAARNVIQLGDQGGGE